jgi:hopanoid biosynthesis associated RND transporter like protein HpnN
VAIATAGVALWYTALTLDFETSRNALASSRERYIQIKEEHEKEFGKIDYIVVVVEPPSLARGKQFVQALVPRLRADTQHFDEVVDRIETTSLEGKKLLLLSPEELRQLQQRLEDSQDFILTLSDNPGLLQLLTAINREITKALVKVTIGGLGLLDPSPSSPDASPEAGQSLDVSFFSALFTEMEQAIAAPDTYRFHSPWAQFFLNDDDVFAEEGYLTSKNDRFLFVLVDDRTVKGSFVKHANALRALRAHIEAIRQDFPDVRAGVTGSQALANDEMLAAQRDTLLGTVIAIIGVGVLFIVAFRQVIRPLLAVTTLLIAVCWALGLTTLTVGHLNIMSVAFMPILIGLGIDFGIHLLARYGEERAHGHNFDRALQAAYQHTGPSVVVAALTTVLAFYAVMLTDFRGLVELGFIAGSGLLLCLLTSFTVLPALLSLYESQRRLPAGVWEASPRDPFRSLQRFPRIAVGLIALVTLAGALLLPWPHFDYNLLNLQAQDTESVVWEYRLQEDAGRSSWYATSVADTLAELRRKKAQFEALPVVDRVASLASVIPADQDVRLPLVRALAPYVQDVSGDWEHPEAVNLDELHVVLEKIRFKLRHKAADWDPQKRPSEMELEAARTALLALQERLRSAPPEVAQSALEAFQQALMADFATKLTLLQRNVNPTPITLADVPENLRQRFVSENGRYLLQIFARDNIWEREPMRAFVTQLEAVDANLAGAPIVAFHSIQQIQHAYTRGGLYALLAIAGMIFLLFRRLKPTLLALVPMLVGGLWTVACMAWLDLQLNMANLIVLPLFIGIAVDNGIHIVHRMLEAPKDATSPLAHSTGKAVVLTSLTSIVGFGSLMVAQHFGVFSLGALAALAVGCSLVATLVILPLLLYLLPAGPSAPSPLQTQPATTAPDRSPPS